MNDKYLHQDELDRMIVRELSRLPFHGPARGFEERVMAQVRLPAARVIVAVRRARAWALEPRRALALAGAYAVCAAVALGFAAPWVLRHSAPIALGLDSIGEWLVATARDLGMTVAGWVLTSRSYETLRSLPVLREHLVPILALVTAAYGAAAIALHRLLKDPRGKHVPVSTSL